jgi:acyl phosphate:glycerol-3-phosphate acyltransferase
LKNPGRKIYHLTGGLVLIALYVKLGRVTGLCTLLGVFVFATAVDLLRLRVKAFNDFMYAHMRLFIRDSERSVLTGTPWYALGILCAAAFYDAPIAVYAVSFLAIGDVSATTIGERWGTIKISGVKSLQGTLAFIAAATIAGLVINFYIFPVGAGIVVAGALTAAAVELIPVNINDNLTIPLISGGLMKILMAMFG